MTEPYDSLGNLIQETQTTADIKTETAYAYNNLNQLIQKGSTAYEYDRRGNLIREKENAEGTAAIGYEGMMYTVTSDRLGSIRRITSPEGTEIAGFTYDAWGRPEKTVSEGYEASGLGVANYTGHLYDETLELYYAKARMYIPEMKKFAAMDPIKSGVNWTRYCLDNPLKFIDPDGEAAQEVSRWQKVKKTVGNYLSPEITYIKAWNIIAQANDCVEEARKNSGGEYRSIQKNIGRGK